MKRSGTKGGTVNNCMKVYPRVGELKRNDSTKPKKKRNSLTDATSRFQSACSCTFMNWLLHHRMYVHTYTTRKHGSLCFPIFCKVVAT